jgi:hypothetical protein
MEKKRTYRKHGLRSLHRCYRVPPKFVSRDPATPEEWSELEGWYVDMLQEPRNEASQIVQEQLLACGLDADTIERVSEELKRRILVELYSLIIQDLRVWMLIGSMQRSGIEVPQFLKLHPRPRRRKNLAASGK